jgi:hypothetical protein
LWWLAWLDHNVRTLFSVQDANGIFRPLFIQLSCSQLGLLTQQPTGSPLSLLTSLVSSKTILNLSPADAACQLAGLGGTNPNPGLSALLPPAVSGLLGTVGLSKDKSKQATQAKSARTAAARDQRAASTQGTGSRTASTSKAKTTTTSKGR